MSHPQRRQLDGIEDLGVAGAAAQVPRERLLHFLARRARALRQERGGGQENGGRAVPDLGGARLGEGLLEGVKAAGLRHPFDGRDAAPLDLDGQHEAGEHGLAVHEHGAGAALPELAAVLGPGEPEVLAEHLQEGLVDRRERLAGLVVDGQGDPDPHWELHLREFSVDERRFKNTESVESLSSAKPWAKQPGAAKIPPCRSPGPPTRSGSTTRRTGATAGGAAHAWWSTRRPVPSVTAISPRRGTARCSSSSPAAIAGRGARLRWTTRASWSSTTTSMSAGSSPGRLGRGAL